MPVSDEVKIRILTDVKQSTKDLAAFGLAVGALYLTFKKVISTVTDLTQEYFKQEQAETKLAAVLKSTGGSAGYTAAQLSDMASEFQRVTVFGDDTVMSAQAVLATFTRIGRDVCPRAVEAAADMSTIMGQDLQSSIVQVGKALNDPIAGVTALRKVGVQLTEQQEKMIKQFVAQGDILSAQKIILGELQTEFGGAARAMGDTTYGAVVKLTNAFSDLKEEMGRLLSVGAAGEGGFLGRLTAGLRQVTSWLAQRGLPEGLKKTTLEVARIQAVIEELRGTLAAMPENGIMGILSGRGRVERQLVEAEEDLVTALIKRGEYLRYETKATQDQIAALDQQAEARAKEEVKLAHLARLSEDYARTEEGRLTILKEMIAYYSSNVWDQNNERVRATLEMYREQATILEGIKDSGPPWGPVVEGVLEEVEAIEIAMADWDEIWRDATEYGGRLTEQLEEMKVVADEVGQSFEAIFDEMERSLAQGAFNVVLDGLREMGAAFATMGKEAKTAQEIAEDMLRSILRMLPQLFLKAGLEVIGKNVPLGLALLAAAGITAIASGAADASAAAALAEETGVSSGGTGASTMRRMGPTYIVQGSLVTERSVDARIAAGYARKVGAY